jgi:hypothetical protein
MSKKALIFLTLVGVLLIRCASPAQMQSWVGANQSELMAKWGEPDQVIQNEPDGKILVYFRTDQYSTRGATDVYRYGSGTRGSDIPGEDYKWKREYRFLVNNDGIVYDWELRKEQVPME